MSIHGSRCLHTALLGYGTTSRQPHTTPSGNRTYATAVDDPKATKTPQTPFPYPTHPRPTAHQIFHLPGGASQAQIKARYYELVRFHHPDSHHCRRDGAVPPQVAHSRFQAIVAAYDYLQGKTSSHAPGAKAYGWDQGSSNFDPYLHELSRRRRAQKAAEAEAPWGEGFGAPKGHRHDDFKEDGTKERTVLALGVLALVLGLYPSFFVFPFQLEKSHKAAVVNLAQARDEAREVGEERRAEIRKRVQDMQDGQQHPRSEA